MDHKKIIVWFRQDLRLADNPALFEAARAGSIIPIYIFDQDGADDFAMGAASRWWLHHSLLAFSKSLDKKLQIYSGSAHNVLQKIIKKYKVDAVYWNQCYEPWMIKRDTTIQKELIDQGLDVKTFNASLLWEPDTIVKSDGTPYKVFTAFFKNGCMRAHAPREIIAKPNAMHFAKNLDTTSVDDLKLLHNNSVQDRFDAYWTPGEDNAMKRFKYFIEHNLQDYKVGRDFPARESVSRLSPHLRFGEISAHQLWWIVQDKGYDFATRANVQHFLTELGWREFAYNVLFHNPDMPRKNLQPKFNSFAWRYDKQQFEAWKHGLTGYPLVDAGMRELWNTGYMHNRIRMVVASFLIKNLMIHWHEGEDWFWQLLLDADLASNSFNWQWVAGCGYDAAPYFRIFNPTTQGKKFDPQGEYIRHWIPELALLPDKYLFEPSLAPEAVLKHAGITIGKTYPAPIVDIGVSRQRALAAFKKL